MNGNECHGDEDDVELTWEERYYLECMEADELNDEIGEQND